MTTSIGSPMAVNASAQALTLASDARSHTTTSMPRLACAARATCAFSRSRAVPITAAPWAAAARAVSSPSPDETPVTRTRLPERSMPASTSSVVACEPNEAVIRYSLLGRRQYGTECHASLLCRSMSSLTFDGDVIVVTGAGGGMGRCHALELADRGARVVVNDLGGHPFGGGSDPGLVEQVVAEIRA